MALFFAGCRCPICDQVLAPDADHFATWGVWLPESDGLSRFCDSVMHWSCYAEWKYQRRFARGYFEFWVSTSDQNPYWKRVFLNDSVLVTVNPKPPVEAAWVYLAATGTRHNPKLGEWGNWLERDDGDRHPLEAQALGNAKQTLRVELPTKAALLSRVVQ